MARIPKNETMEQMADRLHGISRRGKSSANVGTLGGKAHILTGRSSAKASDEIDKRNATQRRGLDTSEPYRGTRLKGKKGTRIVGGGF